MIAYFVFYALIGGISARFDKTVAGLIVVLLLAFTFGIHWLPLSLIEFGFGYLIGRSLRESDNK